LNCQLAFRLGWPPAKAARALLAIDVPAYEELIQASVAAYGRARL